MLVSRRGIIRGLFAAPAIIAVDRLMPIKPLPKTRYVTVHPGVFMRETDVSWIPGRVYMDGPNGIRIVSDADAEREFHVRRVEMLASRDLEPACLPAYMMGTVS